MLQGIRSAFVDLQRRRRSVEQQEAANIFFKEEGITHVITKTHANQAERMIRTFKKNGWRQIEALQKQNMGGSATALVE